MTAINPINVPAGSDVTMLNGEGWVILVAPPGPKQLMAAMLTHDRDVTWPDALGAALANEILASGAPVMLHFQTPNDAMKCLARIIRGTVH